jgi:saposin
MSIVFIALLIVSVFSLPESKREVEQSGGCSICQLVVTYVEEYIGQNQTEQEIIQNLDNLCNQLPMFQSMCVSIVASYAPKIIEWILKNENPQAFCSSVGLCSARSQMKPRKMLMKDHIIRPSKTNKRAEAQSGSCSVCQLVVTYVEEFIKTNQTEQEIIDNLDGLCSQLPIFQDQCVAIVGQYAPELIQWVLDSQNPQAFCANVGLCGTRGLLNNIERNGDEEHHRKWKSHQHKSHKHKSHKADDEEEHQRKWKSHKHKSHKHKSHHKGGVKMEDKMNEDQATIQDTMMVVDEIVEQTKAIVTSKMMIKKGGFKKHPSFRYTNSNSTCSLCQELVAFVQELIARDNTIKQIIEEIRAVCYQIPPPDQQLCLDAVNQEIDALIQWIQDGKHPLEFCTYINVC